VTAKKSKTGISRSALSNLLFIGSVGVISFFLAPFVVHQLGATGFGVWSLVTGLLGYLGMLDLGIRQAVNRFVARHHAVHEHETGSEFTSLALTLFVTTAVVAVLLSFLLALAMPYLFNVPEELLAEAQTIVVLGSVTVAMGLIVGVYGGIVSGVQRFDVQAVIEISVNLLRAGGTVWVLLEGYGLIGLSAVHVASSTLNLIAYRFASRKLYPELRPKLIPLGNPRTRELMAFSSSFFAIHLLESIAFQSDSIIIAIMMPVQSLTFYAIAANLVLQARTIPTAFTYLLTPRISALSSRGSDDISAQILLVGKFAALIVLPVAASFLIRGETFLALWMGPEIAARSAIILAVLAVILWHGTGRSAVINALTGLGLQKILIPVFVVEAVANVALSVALVPLLGILGVAVGTLIPSLIISLVVMPRYLQKATGIDLVDYYRWTVVRPTLAGVPFALASLALEAGSSPDNLAIFFLQIMLILPLMPAAAWFICFNQEEKRFLGNKLAGALRRTRRETP